MKKRIEQLRLLGLMQNMFAKNVYRENYIERLIVVIVVVYCFITAIFLFVFSWRNMFLSHILWKFSSIYWLLLRLYAIQSNKPSNIMNSLRTEKKVVFFNNLLSTLHVCSRNVLALNFRFFSLDIYCILFEMQQQRKQ